MEGSLYRKNFRDIVRGYSSAKLGASDVYIKHLTPHDQVELEEIESSYHQTALRRGVPTEESMLVLLGEEGDWTNEDEREITQSEIFLDSLLSAKSKLILPSQMAKQDTLIDGARKKLEKKRLEKSDLVGNTCEKYAKDRTNDFYIIKSFFKNSNLSSPLFEPKEFDDLNANQLRAIVALYNQSFSVINEDSIQHLILQDFYSAYLNFAEDSMQFYGKPFCELTYCQIKLIVYSRIFKNIFETNDDIPEKIKKDPKALMDYATTPQEEKDRLQDKFSQSDGSTIVGATADDYKELGLGTPGAVDLHEEAKKKGGTLSMQDLMKLSGVD